MTSIQESGRSEKGKKCTENFENFRIRLLEMKEDRITSLIDSCKMYYHLTGDDKWERVEPSISKLSFMDLKNGVLVLAGEAIKSKMYPIIE